MKVIQKLELILFLLYPILATALSLVFSVNILHGVILFLGIPALYLSFRVTFNTAIRSLIFSTILVPVIWIVNFLAHRNLQWIIPTTTVPLFVEGIPMFEVSLWMLFLSHYIVLFYEYFIDRHFVKNIWYPRMKYLFIPVIFGPTLAIMINHFFPLRYFYLIFGIIGLLIPILLVEFKLPMLISKFVKVAMYFFYVTFLYEIVALKLNHWYFPTQGRFIGWVTFFGQQFPAEEFIFWLILCAMSILTYFEYFDDDSK